MKISKILPTRSIQINKSLIHLNIGFWFLHWCPDPGTRLIANMSCPCQPLI